MQVISTKKISLFTFLPEIFLMRGSRCRLYDCDREFINKNYLNNGEIMSKKLGLALGGGGARGVVHVGILKALEEEGIKPYCISGTSMGAIVGACYASGMSVDTIRSEMLKLKTSDIIDFGVPFTRLSLLRSNKLQKLLIKHIGEITFENLEIPFSCTAVDLLNEKLYVFTEGLVAKGVQASAAIPGVFKPIEHEGMLLVDGGVLCRVPVRQAKALGADVVIGIDAIKNTGAPVKELTSIPSVLMRVFDTLDNINVRAERRAPDYPCDLLLEPELNGISQFAVKNLDKVYEEGYQLGKENIEKIKELIAD